MLCQAIWNLKTATVVILEAFLEAFAVLQYFEKSLLRFVCEQESQMQSWKEPHLAHKP